MREKESVAKLESLELIGDDGGIGLTDNSTRGHRLKECSRPGIDVVEEPEVVLSKVKEVVKEAGLRSDGELVSAVSEKVHELLQDAIKRCTSNGRSTVRPHDL